MVKLRKKISKSRGLSLSRGKAEHNSAQGLGLGFFQARAEKDRASGRGIQAEPNRNITIVDYDKREMTYHVNINRAYTGLHR